MGDEYTIDDLISAVLRGKLEKVRQIISSVRPSYLKEWILSKGYCLLRYAVKNKNTEVAKLLLAYGSKVNCNNEMVETPLHFAVKNGDIEIVEMFLDRGANVNAKGEVGRTALHFAVKGGNIHIVEHLLNKGANINCAYTSGWKEHYTPLHLAVEGHFENITKLLLSRGANVDAKGAYGTTALHLAAEGGNLNIVEHLLNHGANINWANTSIYGEYFTPLHFAVVEDFKDITKLLLSRGANVDAKVKDGRTALHIAAENENTDIVEHLLNNGANVDAKQQDGTTALHIAAKNGNIHIVEHLVDSGANINAKGRDGITALRIAYEIWYREIVEYLLNHGADINSAFTSYLREDGSTTFQIGPDWSNPRIAIFLKHHIKVETANMYVNEENLLIPIDYQSGKDFQNECKKEIASMKSEKVNYTNVSFYDILTKNINQLARYAENENIVQVLRSDDYRIKFPIYAGMINSHFKKGEKRKELLEQSNKIFHFFFNNFGLSQECTEEIFSYLSNKDLRILIDTYNYVSNCNT